MPSSTSSYLRTMSSRRDGAAPVGVKWRSASRFGTDVVEYAKQVSENFVGFVLDAVEDVGDIRELTVGGETVSPGPEVRRNLTEYGQEPSGSTGWRHRFTARSRCRVGWCEFSASCRISCWSKAASVLSAKKVCSSRIEAFRNFAADSTGCSGQKGGPASNKSVIVDLACWDLSDPSCSEFLLANTGSFRAFIVPTPCPARCGAGPAAPVGGDVLRLDRRIARAVGCRRDATVAEVGGAGLSGNTAPASAGRDRMVARARIRNGLRRPVEDRSLHSPLVRRRRYDSNSSPHLRRRA